MQELSLKIAGAESNVAIGVRRLGHVAIWRGCVGDDELGRLVLERIRGEGVDADARIIRSRPTALMLREHRTRTVTRVAYYRKGLAGSQLGVEDAEALPLRQGDILHLTGITPALGAGPSAAATRAVERAREVGARVSFDVNYRRALWEPEDAAGPLAALARRSDILFAGEEELALVTGHRSGTDPLRSGQKLGPHEVVLKLGAAGTRGRSGEETAAVAPPEIESVDPVGAGDAFVAGYLSASLDHLPLEGRLTRAVILGAFAASSEGDWESLPRRDELELLTSPTGTTLR